jgi:hypothetical protein
LLDALGFFFTSQTYHLLAVGAARLSPRQNAKNAGDAKDVLSCELDCEPEMSTPIRETASSIAATHLRALPRWTSDSFGVCTFVASEPSWRGAIELTAGGTVSRARQLQVTSADGLHSELVDGDAFIASEHHEAQLTVSADWFVGAELDGYVTSSFQHANGVSEERYVFGTLDATQFQFIDALLEHFAVVVQACPVGMLVISTFEESDADDWLAYFRDGGELTADVLLVTKAWTGRRPTHALTLATTDEIEIYARAL